MPQVDRSVVHHGPWSVVQCFHQHERALVAAAVAAAQSASLQRFHLQHHLQHHLQPLAMPLLNRILSLQRFALAQRLEPRSDSHQSLVPEVLQQPPVVVVVVAVVAADAVADAATVVTMGLSLAAGAAVVKDGVR